jgi:hypothetical protein
MSMCVSAGERGSALCRICMSLGALSLYVRAVAGSDFSARPLEISNTPAHNGRARFCGRDENKILLDMIKRDLAAATF